MVLGKLPLPGRPTILLTVGQGPIALAVGVGGGGLDIFTRIYHFSSASPSLWETARYRLKYCLKGPLNPKQPTNQFNINYFLPRLEASKALVCPTTMFGLVIICAKIGAWHCLLVVNLLKRDKGAHL